jgi:hypothetical protein
MITFYLEMTKLRTAYLILCFISYISCSTVIIRNSGGIVHLNKAPDDLVKFANSYMKQLAMLNKFNGKYTVMKIKDVTSQVVSGIRYVFNVDIATISKANVSGVSLTNNFEH